MTGLFKLILHSHDALDNPSNEIINVFGYRSNIVVVNEMIELANAFRTEVLPKMAAVVSDDMRFTRLEVENVTDGVGYLDDTITPVVFGTRTGDRMPVFTAWGFRYARAVLGKRSGAKRIGSIIRSDVTNGTATAGINPVLSTLADALGAPLHVALIETWFPEILERKAPGLFPWTSHAVSGVSYVRVTTQNSRKR